MKSLDFDPSARVIFDLAAKLGSVIIAPIKALRRSADKTIDRVQQSLYYVYMKQRDLIKKLREYGFYFDREGGAHMIFTDGDLIIPVPRHSEINEITAKSILKKAKNAASGKKEEQ